MLGNDSSYRSSSSPTDEKYLKLSSKKEEKNYLPISRERTEEMRLADNYYVSVSNPFSHELPTPCQPSAFAQYYSRIRSIKLQAFLAVNFIPSFVVVLVQLFTGRVAGASWYTTFSMIAYTIEITIMSLYYRSTRAYFDQLQKIVDISVVWLCVLLEVVAWCCNHQRDVLIILSLFRAVLWAMHGYTRFLQLRRSIGCLCSADRRRYQSEGFDLDLAYITRNMSAMAWPATNFERLFRNSMDEVVDFFATKHPNSYRVVNLCSERSYSDDPRRQLTFMDAKVYPMDDHNPGELELLLRFCRESDQFIQQDPLHRTVSVHCKGGKGRTGTMVCCYLLYTGLKQDANAALYHFARLRTKVGSVAFQGVQAPSQERYVRYFENLMGIPNHAIPSRPLRVKRLVLHHIPPLWYQHDIGRLWFTVIEKPSSGRSIMFISNEDVRFDSKVRDSSTYTAKQMRDLFGTDEDNLYKKCNVMDPTDSTALTIKLGYRLDTTTFGIRNNTTGVTLSHRDFYNEYKSLATLPPDFSVTLEFLRSNEIPVLDGDVCFKFFFARNDPNPLEPPVQFWFHTAFVPSSAWRLSKEEIDGPHKDTACTRYPAEFSIEIEFERE